MSKRKFELVSSADVDVLPEIDWNRCVICQTEKKEKLLCPNNSKQHDKHVGYKSLAEDLLSFDSIGMLPYGIKLSSLRNEGQPLLVSFIENSAKFHKSCRNSCDKYHFERAQDRCAKKSQEEPKDSCSSEDSSLRKGTRSSYESLNFVKATCFFCEGEDDEQNLHRASTMEFDRRIRAAATELCDGKLLAKLSQGDMVAIEAHYHKGCLTKLYNLLRDAKSKESITEKDNSLVYGIALSEVINHIRQSRRNSDSSLVFKLNDLKKLLICNIKRYGVSPDAIHSTRLKEQLLKHVPDLQAYKKGRDVLLSFQGEIGEALFDACLHSLQDDGMCLARAAEIIRNDFFTEFPPFEGHFNSEYVRSSVPQSLLCLIRMLLEGPNCGPNNEGVDFGDETAVNIAQLIIFNSTKRKRDIGERRRPLERETALPVYLGLLVHTKTRKASLVDKFSKLGVSISYDRVRDIKAAVTNQLCKEYEEKNLVCPTSLKDGIFTTAAIDNIDHNVSATSAQKHFHGTGISLFQHPDETTEENVITVNTTSKSKIIGKPQLPEYYLDIAPVAKGSVLRPITTINAENGDMVHVPLKESEAWLKQTELLANKDVEPELSTRTSWSAFHEDQKSSLPRPKCLSALMPLIDENINSLAMVKHTMKVTKRAVDSLNKNQIPVITADQPVYALGKQVQWLFPHYYGEDKFVIMMGGLHIEMATLSMIGDWLEGSGWSDLITTAQVFTSGTSEALLSAFHVKKSRYAHQVSVAALHLLLKTAYEKRQTAESEESFDSWVDSARKKSAQFEYAFVTYELELLLLMFVKSIRVADFKMFCDALEQIIPWMFALDHVHYARWLPVFLQDLKELSTRHPDVYQEFLSGKFTVQKTNRKFSSMATDQAHEQNNKLVKEEGGAIGILQSPKALMQWMEAGPEIARMITEFGDIIVDADPEEPIKSHHENTTTFEKRFRKDVKSMYEAFIENGNPFEEEEDVLITLGSKVVMGEQARTSVREARQAGKDQYEAFKVERLITSEKSVHDVIKKNKLPLFRQNNSIATKRSREKISSLKQDCNLYASLYVACQTRESDLDDFFSHENHSYPPALSVYGKIRHSTKSDCVKVLTKYGEVCCEEPLVTGLILDGAAIVQMTPAGESKKFGEYADKEFANHLVSRAKSSSIERIDVVFDVYRQKSIKASTREDRGIGSRVRVVETTPVIRNWRNFLRVNENKEELFRLIAAKCVNNNRLSNVQLVFTAGENVLTNNDSIENLSLAPCNHEEADTRVFVHAKNMAESGHRKIMIKTVDTDVIIIAIAVFHELLLEELWIEFGTGKDRRWFPIHEYASRLGEQICSGILFWYAFTGCDTTSSFAGRGKTSAWETWRAFPEVTESFKRLSDCPSAITEDDWALIERYVILLYDRSSLNTDVNSARRQLFTKKGRPVDGLPPTKDALIQHTFRATYQSG